ncbi:MAG: Uma2 family endonuclease [Oscillatoria sp. PMC 1068.18]|nr:Uma2 family endonuclease [Oscillatoria sp. PMC 1076.18]MEC4987625.1 Uma2 family endonuclease [Oscillatoria sp. PMC 1068.18]
MVSELKSQKQTEVIYPESDGKPMADNTKQFRWIVVIKENLEWLFGGDRDVFVAGDLFWYPVEGNNRIVNAPDAMVIFGRPKGDRSSYKQWSEEGIAPQVVFEIRSPANTRTEMDRKLLFYDRYGVEEYYIYDPDRQSLSGWLRVEEGLDAIAEINGWVSPRLGIRFEISGEELQIYRPDGIQFFSYVEVCQLLEQEKQRTEQEKQRAEQEKQRAEQEKQRAEQAEQRLRETELMLQQYRERFGDLPSDEG